MKCYKCHFPMIKETNSRTAICPNCGRTVTYRTNADKKYDNNSINKLMDNSGCSAIFGLLGLAIIIFPILLLIKLFGSGFLSGIGSVFGFIFNIIWSIIKFCFSLIWGIVSGLFHFIFG